MAKAFVKKGNTVQIIAGKDRGKTGKVLRVLAKTEKVLVENINLLKKHTRPNPQKLPDSPNLYFHRHLPQMEMGLMISLRPNTCLLIHTRCRFIIDGENYYF